MPGVCELHHRTYLPGQEFVVAVAQHLAAHFLARGMADDGIQNAPADVGHGHAVHQVTAVHVHVVTHALAVADLALITADDHQALLNLSTLDAAVQAAQALDIPEVVIKRGAAPTLVRSSTTDWDMVPTQRVACVVDTTAAGDSFAAGYLSQRLLGASPAASALFGNRLAARVIGHPGAIIAASAMADLLESTSQPVQQPG